MSTTPDYVIARLALADPAQTAALVEAARLWGSGYVPHTGPDHARAAISRYWPELREALETMLTVLPPVCWRCGEFIEPGLTANYPADQRPSHGTCPRDLDAQARAAQPVAAPVERFRICWPDPDATCLEGGCSHCADARPRPLTMIIAYANRTGYVSDRVGEGRKDASHALAYGLSHGGPGAPVDPAVTRVERSAYRLVMTTRNSRSITWNVIVRGQVVGHVTGERMIDNSRDEEWTRYTGATLDGMALPAGSGGRGALAREVRDHADYHRAGRAQCRVEGELREVDTCRACSDLDDGRVVLARDCLLARLDLDDYDPDETGD